MQLAHHHPLGTIDNELAAAEHDRHIAQVDLFLDRLFTREPQIHPERPSVGEPQLPALVRAVAGLAEFVPQVLDLDRAVIALDREDLPEHAFDAVVLALVRWYVVLQECVVESRLDFGEVRDVVRHTTAAEMSYFAGLETADGVGCH